MYFASESRNDRWSSLVPFIGRPIIRADYVSHAAYCFRLKLETVDFQVFISVGYTFHLESYLFCGPLSNPLYPTIHTTLLLGLWQKRREKRYLILRLER